MSLRFQDTSPLWLEHWSEAIQRLSMPSLSIRLGRTDMMVLGSQIRGHRHRFVDGAPLDASELRRELDRAVGRFSKPFVVRLGSRSPKDCDLWMATGGQLWDGHQLWRLLTCGSRRLADDLVNTLAMDSMGHLHLRAWRPMQSVSEIRVFYRQRRMIAASQYDSQSPDAGMHLYTHRKALCRALCAFEARFAAHAPLDDLVADLWFDPDTQDVELIDLNPFHRRTGAALFTWSELDMTRGLRLRMSDEVVEIGLTSLKL